MKPHEEILDLDLATLLQMMQQRRETCLLTTAVKRPLPSVSLRPPYTLTLQIIQGSLTACVIATAQQQVTSAALPAGFPMQTLLTWTLRSVQAPPAQPPPRGVPNPVQLSPAVRQMHPASLWETDPIPVRAPLRPGSEAAIAALPRTVRQIYALIDGTRSLNEIARLLHYSPEQIKNVLQYLQSQHLLL